MKILSPSHEVFEKKGEKKQTYKTKKKYMYTYYKMGRRTAGGNGGVVDEGQTHTQEEENYSVVLTSF